MRMVRYEELSDQLATKAALDIEHQTGMPIRSRHLTPTALTHLCHQRPRDLLSEMLDDLHPWDKQPRLNTWLETYAHAPKTHLNRDISRLLLVSMVARALDPGCQYRYVVILEGPENAGKSKLVEALAGPEWYREISHGLEGKEAHMRIRRAWVAELAELSSYGKTEESRLKAFFTLREDAYIPKFSNFEVTHKRRTVFIGTLNPEGDESYLKGQTGNTRYLPVRVRDINIEGFNEVRDDLFAEALYTYRKHPNDWWQLSSTGEYEAVAIREERRQQSIYEDDLGNWLERHGKQVTWWEDLAENYLKLDRDKWANRILQMDITKALNALGWRKGKRERISGALVYPWRPTDDWRTTP
jgi:putative DNA primase/helicase